YSADPPSLPGIALPPDVICAWRQALHEVSGSRDAETADSVIGLCRGSGLETGAAHRSRQTHGIVPAACRSQTEFPSRPEQEPVLLLWLRTWRRCDPLRRAVSRRAIR